MREGSRPLVLALVALCLALAPASSEASWWTSIKDFFSPPKVSCPPSGFDSVPDFNVSAYAAAPWYPQQQIPLIYQKSNDLYCVQAQYKALNAADPAKGLAVYNYGRSGSVNGSSMGSNPGSRFQMVALPEGGAASKLQVGPKGLSFAKFIAYGPYWVVATGPSANSTLKYDWAVVSGGAPKMVSGSKCSTFYPLIPTTTQYKGGLWLFTRKPVDPEGAAAALAAATALGIDTGGLMTVQQAGCTYPATY